MTNEAKLNEDTVEPLVVWILICRSWNGNTYDTEICGGYDDENKARERAKIYQGNQKLADIEYLVEQHIIDRTHNIGGYGLAASARTSPPPCSVSYLTKGGDK